MSARCIWRDIALARYSKKKSEHWQKAFDKDSASGERRLPACTSRQLAETGKRHHLRIVRAKMLPAGLPATTGWQPVLPRHAGRVRYPELLRIGRLCKIGHSRPSYRSDTDYSRSR